MYLNLHLYTWNLSKNTIKIYDASTFLYVKRTYEYQNNGWGHHLMLIISKERSEIKWHDIWMKSSVKTFQRKKFIMNHDCGKIYLYFLYLSVFKFNFSEEHWRKVALFLNRILPLEILVIQLRVINNFLAFLLFSKVKWLRFYFFNHGLIMLDLVDFTHFQSIFSSFYKENEALQYINNLTKILKQYSSIQNKNCLH